MKGIKMAVARSHVVLAVLVLMAPALAGAHRHRWHLAQAHVGALPVARLVECRGFLEELRILERSSHDTHVSRARLLRGLDAAIQEARDVKSRFTKAKSDTGLVERVEAELLLYREILSNEYLNDIDTRDAIRSMGRDGDYLSALEGRLDGIENRLLILKSRVNSIEEHDEKQEGAIEAMEKMTPRRHDAYVSLSVLFSDAWTMDKNFGMGMNLAAQLNFGESMGVFAGIQGVTVSDLNFPGIPPGSTGGWTNRSLHLGGVLHLTPVSSYVSAQAGVGFGGYQSVLFYGPTGNPSSSPSVARESYGLFLLAKAELGVAPPSLSFEPFGTLGFMVLNGSPVDTVLQTTWYVAVGARWRIGRR